MADLIISVPDEFTDPEIRALHIIVAAMAEVDPVTASRVAGWVYDRWNIPEKSDSWRLTERTASNG